MSEGTDWTWCYENPKEAASLIDALEAERDALRKSVDQLADTLKNVHEAVCETLGIEGDDALPELVADWAEGEYATLRKDAERYRWIRRDRTEREDREIIDIFVDTCEEYFDADIDAAIAAKEPK